MQASTCTVSAGKAIKACIHRFYRKGSQGTACSICPILGCCTQAARRALLQTRLMCPSLWISTFEAPPRQKPGYCRDAFILCSKTLDEDYALQAPLQRQGYPHVVLHAFCNCRSSSAMRALKAHCDSLAAGVPSLCALTSLRPSFPWHYWLCESPCTTALPLGVLHCVLPPRLPFASHLLLPCHLQSIISRFGFWSSAGHCGALCDIEVWHGTVGQALLGGAVLRFCVMLCLGPHRNHVCDKTSSHH